MIFSHTEIYSHTDLKDFKDGYAASGYASISA
jgi:hypothetical protein